MHALIMAGGSGSRLNLGEKPLILLLGRPMIAYVTEAFLDAGVIPVVAGSPHTPMTMNWCRAQGIDCIGGSGRDYISDMVEAVTSLEDQHPLFVCVSDIPCITAESITVIADAYRSSKKDACSAWVPAHLVLSSPRSMPYLRQVDGADACPAGVNILRGDLIAEPQDELQILMNEPGLALNVNTREDRARAEEFLRQRSRVKSPGF